MESDIDGTSYESDININDDDLHPSVVGDVHVKGASRTTTLRNENVKVMKMMMRRTTTMMAMMIKMMMNKSNEG